MQGIFRGLRHLAIIALLVRAMLPAGWMPDAQGLVICSTSLSPVIHHDGGQKAPEQHQDCAFAAAAHLAAAPDAPKFTLPAFHAFAAGTDNARAATIAARFSPGSPRAPPLTV